MQDDFNGAALRREPNDMGRELLAELNKSPAECDREKCLRLIRSGAYLEEASTDPSNSSELPLGIALRQGYDDVAKALIEAGADLNNRDESGNNALMIAAVYGRKDLAAIIIARGVNLDEINGAGHTALIWAGYWGKAEIAAMLVREGAKTDIRDQYGHTALEWTVVNDNFTTAEAGEVIKAAIEERSRFEDWRDQGMPLKEKVTVSRPLTLKLRKPLATFSHEFLRQ
jgi:uncharacterized protein